MVQERIVLDALLAIGSVAVLVLGGCGLAPDVTGWSFPAAGKAGLTVTESVDDDIARGLKGRLVMSRAEPVFKAIDEVLDDLLWRKLYVGVAEADFGVTLINLRRRLRDAEERWSFEAGELRGELRRMSAQGSNVDVNARDDVQRRLDAGNNWRMRVEKKLLEVAELHTVRGLR